MPDSLSLMLCPFLTNMARTAANRGSFPSFLSKMACVYPKIASQCELKIADFGGVNKQDGALVNVIALHNNLWETANSGRVNQWPGW